MKQKIWWISIQYGQGDKTIVILPGFGSQSPVIQYKTLVEGLRDNYRVVVVEYFGYGYSMGIKEERSNDKIAGEIKKLLEVAEINGPYVLMPHSLSNIYAMKFAEKYPDDVQAIISIDGTFPNEVEDSYRLSKIKDTVTNVNITSIWELTGFERILSYISPKTFYIDKMKERSDIFTSEDLKVYRNRIGSSYLTRTMVREAKKIEENMKEMKDYKYPSYLPVLEILSTDTIKEYKEDKDSGNATVDLIDLASIPITNKDIQVVYEIEGDHMLQLSNPATLVSSIKAFLANF